MSYAKGDRVRVTIEGTVDRVTADGHWLEMRTPGRYPILMGFAGEAEGVTVERLPSPEPLYVNAPEITEPEVGDVVRDAEDEDTSVDLWYYRGHTDRYEWLTMSQCAVKERAELPEHLTLLVRHGKVWPS